MNRLFVLALAAAMTLGFPHRSAAHSRLLGDPGRDVGLGMQSGAPEKDEEDEREKEEEGEQEEVEEGQRIRVRYSKGLEITSGDGNYRAHIELRFQGRFSHPFDSDPRDAGDFAAPEESTFEVNRGRLKIGGHAYRPWLGYYLEYDFPSSRLLDFRLTLSKLEWLQLRVGQGKAIYSAERVVSSGKQQFVERSIVNREFTLDRQQGVQLFGRLLEGTPGDSWYWLGVFSGNGRGAGNDDDHLMWMGRYQWNFLGRDPKFSMSDVERHSRPAAYLALAAATNRSAFTRFSSAGGDQLDGFEDGEPGRYDVDQWLAELAFKRRGFSLLSEYHEKRIEDLFATDPDAARTRLEGGYLQAGYFFHEILSKVPEELELAARWAFVDPDASRSDDRRHELTLAVNWFFAGHRNKLTLDASRLSLEVPGGAELAENRIRLQWDVSF